MAAYFVDYMVLDAYCSRLKTVMFVISLHVWQCAQINVLDRGISVNQVELNAFSRFHFKLAQLVLANYDYWLLVLRWQLHFLPLARRLCVPRAYNRTLLVLFSSMKTDVFVFGPNIFGRVSLPLYADRRLFTITRALLQRYDVPEYRAYHSDQFGSICYLFDRSHLPTNQCKGHFTSTACVCIIHVSFLFALRAEGNGERDKKRWPLLISA